MSKRKLISQAEARALRVRVSNLEKKEELRRNAWVREWPDGVHLCSLTFQPEHAAMIKTARKLGHAVVATSTSSNEIHIYALPLAAGASK